MHPILVTGAHRSGTTWIGRVLAASPTIGYIHEPFNPEVGVFAARFPVWFMRITADNACVYREPLRRMLAFDYDLRGAILEARQPPQLLSAVRDAAQFWWFRRQDRRPLVKDPIAVFSADWLASTFAMDVVILIRHPAAFAWSLKRLEWTFDFRNFLEQPLLMRDYLEPFRPQIEQFAVRPPGIIAQAGLLWSVIYATVARFRDEHPEWVYLRLEDVASEPEPALRAVCERLDIPFSDHIQRRIAATTAASSPIDVWRSRLSRAEVEELRAAVAPVASRFYGESEW